MTMPLDRWFISATLVTVITVTLIFVAPKAPTARYYNVAFIGNSITFVNDLPRFMEALSEGHIRQNSCLHGGLSFSTQLVRGNGMYHKWNNDISIMDYDEQGQPVYDYGACTVPHLLYGNDENLTEGNENGYYYNDRRNPCFQDSAYYEYMMEHYQPLNWDFVVLNDRTTNPALYNSRQDSLQALNQSYIQFFRDTGARPVLLQTYGYAYSDFRADDDDGYDNSETLGNITEFTSHVYWGYHEYAKLLSEANLEPLVAPVGLAFLVLWEENYGLWERLFYVDYLHPSPHGSFLMGCVLYATLFGRMPPTTAAIDGLETLWQRARKMEVGGSGEPYTAMPLPDQDEAAFLYETARRVTLEGHMPSTLLSQDETLQLEASNKRRRRKGR